MSKIHIISAMGVAPEQPINAATLTDLDTVDSNRVHIVGPVSPAPVVTITSFGPGTLVEKRCRFDARIIIQHDPVHLILLTGANRSANAGDVGEYFADQNGVWREESWQPKSSTITYTTSQNIFVPFPFTKAFIKLVGGGGGGSNASGIPRGAGGCGGYLEKTLTGLVPGATIQFTAGIGGLGSQNGGQSLLQSGSLTIPTLTANGGSSGLNIGAATSPGGTATGGDVNITGGAGHGIVGGSATVDGTYDSHSNAISPAQTSAVNVGGLPLGGGGITVTTGAALPAAPGLCIITWSL
jgi:hypothetical protein